MQDKAVMLMQGFSGYLIVALAELHAPAGLRCLVYPLFQGADEI